MFEKPQKSGQLRARQRLFQGEEDGTGWKGSGEHARRNRTRQGVAGTEKLPLEHEVLRDAGGKG